MIPGDFSLKKKNAIRKKCDLCDNASPSRAFRDYFMPTVRSTVLVNLSALRCVKESSCQNADPRHIIHCMLRAKNMSCSSQYVARRLQLAEERFSKGIKGAINSSACPQTIPRGSYVPLSPSQPLVDELDRRSWMSSTTSRVTLTRTRTLRV